MKLLPWGAHRTRAYTSIALHPCSSAPSTPDCPFARPDQSFLRRFRRCSPADHFPTAMLRFVRPTRSLLVRCRYRRIPRLSATSRSRSRVCRHSGQPLRVGSAIQEQIIRLRGALVVTNLRDMKTNVRVGIPGYTVSSTTRRFIDP